MKVKLCNDKMVRYKALFELRNYKIVIIGILFGILYWLIESIIHTYIFIDEQNFIEQPLFPPAHELYVRTMIIFLFIISSIYSQFLFIRKKEAKHSLKEFEYKLKERVKELTCLYGLSKLAEILNFSLEDIFQGTLDLIPPAWQFPEITCTRIIFDNKEFKTSNFEETKWKLSTSTKILGKELNIEAYYLEDKPFLKEEENLIDDLGKRLKIIIEQKEAKQKLKESEEWLSTTLKSIGDGVITIDTNGNITFLNPVAESLSGWKQEDVIGHHINEIFIVINEFTRNPVDNPALKALQEGKPIGLASNTLLITKNKKEIYIDDTGAPIKDKYGNIIGAILVFKDITKRRIAVQKLIESKHNLSERVKELTCLYGLSKLVGNFNLSLEDIFQGILDLIPPAWQFPEITCARIIFDNKEFKTSNFEETEWKLSTSTKLLGKELNIEAYYLEDKPFLKEEEYLIDDFGKRLKIIIEQKEAEQKLIESEKKYKELSGELTLSNEEYLEAMKELEKAKKDLEKASEDLEKKVEERTKDLNKALEQLTESSQFKTEFLATMSHELRTPLNHLIPFTELLLEGGFGPLNQEQLDVLKDIKSSAEELLKMVIYVLNMADMEKGQFKLNFEEFSLKNSIDQVESDLKQSDLKPLMDEKGLKFKIKGLKPEKKIFADPIRFKEILFNLLSNAIKFTIEGNITLIVQENRSNWTFSVKDTGIGIADEDRDIIFEVFRRVNSPYVNSVPGTGLGLFITSRLVDLHEGEKNFESELGKGSTFSFTIPKSLRNQDSSVENFLKII